MNNKREYVKKLETELKKWGVNIEEFKTQATKTRASAKTAVLKRVAVLRAKQKKVRAQIGRLRASSDGAWTDLKGGAERALAELKTSVRKAAAQFR